MELKATGHTDSHVGPKLNTALVHKLLVSLVTKILLSPGFSWSKVVRHSVLSTRDLIDLNVA